MRNPYRSTEYIRVWVCDSLGYGACDTSIVPAVIVQVEDSLTGRPAAEGATGQVTEGSFSDPLRPHGSNGQVLVSLAGADERPGRYTVSVQRTGYLNWSKSSVLVREGECHVRTVTVIARLVPTP